MDLPFPGLSAISPPFLGGKTQQGFDLRADIDEVVSFSEGDDVGDGRDLLHQGAIFGLAPAQILFNLGADPEFGFQGVVGLLQLGGPRRHADFQVILGQAQGLLRLDPGDGAAHLGRQGLQGRPGRGRHFFILVGSHVIQAITRSWWITGMIATARRPSFRPSSSINPGRSCRQAYTGVPAMTR